MAPRTTAACFGYSQPSAGFRPRRRRTGSMNLRGDRRNERALGGVFSGTEFDGHQFLAVVDGEDVALVEDGLCADVLARRSLAERRGEGLLEHVANRSFRVERDRDELGAAV